MDVGTTVRAIPDKSALPKLRAASGGLGKGRSVDRLAEVRRQIRVIHLAEALRAAGPELTPAERLELLAVLSGGAR